MPSEVIKLNRHHFFIVILLTVVMMVVNISPYAFLGLSATGGFEPQPGPGLIPFSLLSTAFSILAVYWLFKKYRRSIGTQKRQLGLVLIGILMMLALIIVTVLLPIIIRSSTQFLVFTPLYTLIFLGMTAYAIVRYKLFNLKVLATEAIVTILLIALFAKLLVSADLSERFVDFLIFAAALIFGTLLVKSVREEVRHREELQILTSKLEGANEKLEELSSFKTQLLSIASHQIKSPIAAVKGFATILLEGLYGPIDGKVRDTIEKIKLSADDLINLINTLLDLRRVDEGKMGYQFSKIDMGQVISQVVDQLQLLARGKNLSLVWKPPLVPVFINADAQNIRQVFQNIIDNAIKYTKAGGVTVELTTEGDKARFSVQDTGIGIPAELIPNLFEEFVRDENIKKEILGTGLGLYIARRIVEAHQGKIWATSPGRGKGATFYVVLPLYIDAKNISTNKTN